MLSFTISLFYPNFTLWLWKIWSNQLNFPGQVYYPDSQTTNISSLGMGSGTQDLGQININGTLHTFKPPHQDSLCLPTTEFTCGGTGAFSSKRRKRSRCRYCQAHTTYQCTVCKQWICNQATPAAKRCFSYHYSEKVSEERRAHWESLQSS